MSHPRHYSQPHIKLLQRDEVLAVTCNRNTSIQFPLANRALNYAAWEGGYCVPGKESRFISVSLLQLLTIMEYKSVP